MAIPFLHPGQDAAYGGFKAVRLIQLPAARCTSSVAMERLDSERDWMILGVLKMGPPDFWGLLWFIDIAIDIN